MLAELLTSLLTPFPRIPRRMGYLAEQIAIRARHGRCRAAWRPHLDACHAAMLAAAERCPVRNRCVVIGAGLCLDIPLQRLAAMFRDVVLLDVGFLQRRGPANVQRVPWDVSGSLVRWFDDPRMADAEALAVTDPGWPAGLDEPDLTISAGVLSQLHFLPSAWLGRRCSRGPEFTAALADRLGRQHLSWLRSRPGQQLLITDLAEIIRDRAGRETERTPTAVAALDLPPPQQTWEWRLAPAPEVDVAYDVAHQVGCW